MILTCFVAEWYNRGVEVGARVLVAGAAVFKKDKSVSETMKELRASFEG